MAPSSDNAPRKSHLAATAEGGAHHPSGGKGGSGPSTKNVTYSYYGRFAIGVCEGSIAEYGRIWADGKLIRYAGGGKYEGYMTFYTGTETQAPDPTIQSYEGTANTPAFKGIAYIVFDDLPLADFRNRIPNLKIEVITKDGATAAFDSEFQGKSTYLRDLGLDAVFRSEGHGTDTFGEAYETRMLAAGAWKPAATSIDL